MTDSKAERKRLTDDYRNRKTRRGIFAVRCTPTGRTWVGASPDLDAARNSTWFSLRTGAHRDAPLQAEWRTHGEEAFRYDVLEELEDDVSPLLVRDLLKSKKAEWAAREQAGVLLP